MSVLPTLRRGSYLYLRIAHRGMSHRIRENTLLSFALALENKVDGIELDVHVTADNVVVVNHDATLADGRLIESVTHADLLGQERDPGMRIPTLAETCALVNGRAALFIEIKALGIELRVVEALRRYSGEIAIHSFDHAQIARLNASGCDYRLGILFDEPLANLTSAMLATGARDVWPHFSLVTHELVATAHALGGRVIPWTVNDLADALDLIALGVDGLCSDDFTELPVSA